jgi:hypothetical protein
MISASISAQPVAWRSQKSPSVMAVRSRARIASVVARSPKNGRPVRE